ncbi:MAG TPA: acyl-CoA dehydrogenase C-terminal domain-containing protein [Candidatus Cybelea sp.]|jgi:alkylation response protein AidB-like acyl-CoA dehydrogenase|nr:acyl-CoA dehydrogenase C-terminal domain-containing protein [Candidatus Cybelea sp.]
MSTYRAPLRDMQFALRELAGIEEIAALPGCGETLEVLDSVLEEAAAFASGVLDPLNRTGDKEGCRWDAGEVSTPPGFKEAYKKFAQAGWIGLPVPEEYGGQGLPQIMLGPTLEMWNGANIGFANGPLLNQGAIEAIELVGSHEQKQRYIPNLVSGKWTGTMCLTEPQAGSDLAQVRARAVPEGDHHLITGTKIFITFGEHDMAENIVHLVLARLPDAPEGTKGISLFIVPKVLVNDDGSLGERNDVVCAGIEHKLGINGNPTCTLNYGEKGKGAVGYLVGEANRGLEYMFIMMNAARFSVGVQGIALADRAYQSALEYALERVQGRDLKPGSREPEAIFKHPDVRRMLMLQKATIEAMRGLAYVTAASLDFAARHPDEKVRKAHKAFVELMIPVVKGWCTENAVDLCSVALQVFGGTGYIEETGIAQQYRDVRIITIYEGTTGIQSLDLVGRKLLRDMGAAARTVGKQMEAVAKECAGSSDATVKRIGEALGRGLEALNETSQWIGMNAMGDLHKAFACSVPYLRLWGTVAGGWQMARAAQIASKKIAANDPDADFYRAKLTTAAFYATHVLSQCAWYAKQIVDGSGDVMALNEAQFGLDRKLVAGV